MTLQDLIRRYRVLAKDAVQPYRTEDADVTDWLNDAVEQACIRGRLLREGANTQVSRIALTQGQQIYPLHPAVYELIAVRVLPAGGGRGRPLSIVSQEWLETELPNWRDHEGEVRWLIQDDTSIQLVGRVNDGEILAIECYRLPLVNMALDDDEPEIHQAHHVHLIHWALHKAFSVPDSELFDQSKSAESERAFTDYFGLLPDSGLRRTTREDTQHHVYGYLA